MGLYHACSEKVQLLKQLRNLLIKHFIVKLMHTTLKHMGFLKRFKTKEAAPTCFGLQ